MLAAPAAHAAPVLVIGNDGRVHEHVRSLAPATAFPPVRAASPVRALAAAKRAQGPTVIAELQRMLGQGAIDQPTFAARRAAYLAATRTVKRLTGTRRKELGAVVSTLEDIAARRQLTPSRLTALWLTLERNVRWWTTGPLLAPGRRVGFDGSQIVWQYYPGAGLQIQVLGTFGKVNALWSTRRTAALRQIVDEVLPLAAERAGGLAWEYYFPYRAGKPPWVSSLAQGTALQALARAAERLGRRDDILPITSRALTVFDQPPPEGVRVPVGAGVHYAQYSFEPKLRILNGFIQSLVGLVDYARIAPDAHAQQLFADGVARARQEVPSYDTGAWSLYSRGSVTHESDLGYHKLLRDFLAALCDRTADPVFCTAEQHLTAYLALPPVIDVRTTELAAGRYGRIRLALSKISLVSLRIERAGKLVHARYVGALAHGRHSLGWSVPSRPGEYDVQLTARDLAGNPASVTSPIEVLAPPKKKQDG